MEFIKKINSILVIVAGLFSLSSAVSGPSTAALTTEEEQCVEELVKCCKGEKSKINYADLHTISVHEDIFHNALSSIKHDYRYMIWAFSNHGPSDSIMPDDRESITKIANSLAQRLENYAELSRELSNLTIDTTELTPKQRSVVEELAKCLDGRENMLTWADTIMVQENINLFDEAQTMISRRLSEVLSEFSCCTSLNPNRRNIPDNIESAIVIAKSLVGILKDDDRELSRIDTSVFTYKLMAREILRCFRKQENVISTYDKSTIMRYRDIFDFHLKDTEYSGQWMKLIDEYAGFSLHKRSRFLEPYPPEHCQNILHTNRESITKIANALAQRLALVQTRKEQYNARSHTFLHSMMQSLSCCCLHRSST